jgi:hypothetical protein
MGAYVYKRKSTRNYGAKSSLSEGNKANLSQTASDSSQPKPVSNAGILSPSGTNPTRKGNGLFSRFRKTDKGSDPPKAGETEAAAAPKSESPSVPENTATSEQFSTPSLGQALVKPMPHKPAVLPRPLPKFPRQAPKGLRPIPSSAVPIAVRLRMLTHGSKRYLVQQVPVSSPMAPMLSVQQLPPEALLAKFQKAYLATHGGGSDVQTRPKKNFRLRLMKIQRRRLADNSSLPKLDTVPLPVVRPDNRKPTELVEFL